MLVSPQKAEERASLARFARERRVRREERHTVKENSRKTMDNLFLKAVVFDFDGVILESADIKTEAFREMFEAICPEHIDEVIAYHIENEGISRYAKFRHLFKAFLRREITEQEEHQLGEKFSQLVLNGILHAPFVPGALEFLKEHHSRYRLFVASGTPEDELKGIVAKRGIAGYFQEVHGSPKKKPHVLGDIMTRYGWQAGEVVFVGDAPSDMNAAGATGVHFVARIRGGRDLPVNPARKIDDLHSLAAALEKLT
jgi:HAD superfamily hydrolase (TIGR01549 family)